MYYREHPPPHFHAIYAEHEAIVALDTGEIIEGTLPRRAHKLVKDWATDHTGELQDNWELARAEQPLN